MILNENNNNGAKEPALNGLVLAGGKSKRMGHDKSIIPWHGREQRYYVADLLRAVCSEVYISCREEQQKEINPEYNILVDAVTDYGPLGGIHSAFKKHPETAWLVVACDLPLLDLKTLQYLIANRNTGAIATTFESPFDGLPEPLVTIWEPDSWQVLQSLLDGGFSCPRKALIRNKDLVRMLKAPDPQALMNANTPDDAARVRETLSRF